MKVLSLFDGMACGMLAMQKTGIEVERYVAYEIDKYAVQTSSHNFPMIEHRGDVFQADFTEFSDFDFLIGGSPCTYWSIAQKNNRETEASGMGWELFSQYVRALHEAKPRFFIYENNKSMSKAIRESITQTFGFEPICINSALVSAQNRQRLYWVGKRNADGTYSKVDIEQPEDRGILLRDVLESGYAWRYKQGCIDANYFKGGNFTSPQKQSGQRLAVAEPVGTTKDGKSYCLTAGYANGSGENIGNYAAHTIEKGCKSMVAEPCRVGCYPSPDGTIKNSQGMRIYSVDGKSVNITAQGGGMGAKTGLYAIPCCNMPVVDMTQPNSKTRRGRNMADKSNCCMTSCQYYQYCGVLAYATPCEWDENGNATKAVSVADGKKYAVYEVNDGYITIKGKTYPIKLVDGYYIIRKLTVRECMRLQTVPEWYDFPVSDSQAYKMLGNGWTVDVIAHILKGLVQE